jgi:hypothetical protein
MIDPPVIVGGETFDESGQSVQCGLEPLSSQAAKWGIRGTQAAVTENAEDLHSMLQTLQSYLSVSMILTPGHVVGVTFELVFEQVIGKPANQASAIDASMKTPSVRWGRRVVKLIGCRIAEGWGVEEAELQYCRSLVAGQGKGWRPTLQPEPLPKFIERL